MPDHEFSAGWVETQPGYAHGFPPYIPGTKHKLLSRGGARLSSKDRARFNDADMYFLTHLYERYGSTPFKRGDLDAGRINRLLGREIVFAAGNRDPSSIETMLRIQTSPAEISSGPERGRQYRYGVKPTWRIVLDVVREFERPVSAAEVADRIAATVPGFARTNVRPDLSTLSVNCSSRGNYGPNRRPRKTNSGSPYDQLIKVSSGRDVRYAVYEPSIHGVWELVDVGGKVLSPRFLQTADQAEIEAARNAAVASGLFALDVDARRRIVASIVQREGQPTFRRALLEAYKGMCAISGCTIEALLEAAHIVPYQGAHTNIVPNGLLLRADLHKLFDLHLLGIDPGTLTVRLSPGLKHSEYACFDGIRLREPESSSIGQLTEALTHHYDRCGWQIADSDDASLDGRNPEVSDYT